MGHEDHKNEVFDVRKKIAEVKPGFKSYEFFLSQGSKIILRPLRDSKLYTKPQLEQPATLRRRTNMKLNVKNINQ
jgi:hypothetical protein